MQRGTPLRDPFATDDELSASSAGRLPPHFPRSTQAPLRNVDQLPLSRPSQPAPALGAPRSIAPRSGLKDGASASTSSTTVPPSLGLSLGLPRNRAKASRSGQTNDPANAAFSSGQSDEAVRNTDSDALLSRLSALRLGYLPPEPFTQEFSTASPSSSGHPSGRPGLPQSHHPDVSTRRSPLINIGTYLRCSTIDAEVESFLQQGDEAKQIISIGAGSDSRYWRIMADPVLSRRLHHYVEVDFAENAHQKLSRILRSSILRDFLDPNTDVEDVPLTNFAQPGQGMQQQNASDSKRFDVLRSSKYSLLAADVRNLHTDTSSSERIDLEHLLGPASTGLDPAVPTLILFECVLAYIAPEKADWLIRLLGERFADIQALSYDIALAGDSRRPAASTSSSGVIASAERTDTVGTADRSNSDSLEAPHAPAQPSRFGKVMLQNLEMRKLSLPGARAYPTHHAQSQRFVQAWSGPSAPDSRAEHVETSGRSLFSIWLALEADQKARLSRLEGLDEVEEIDMLLQHYCIVQARRKRS